MVAARAPAEVWIGNAAIHAIVAGLPTSQAFRAFLHILEVHSTSRSEEVDAVLEGNILKGSKSNVSESTAMNFAIVTLSVLHRV